MSSSASSQRRCSSYSSTSSLFLNIIPLLEVKPTCREQLYFVKYLFITIEVWMFWPRVPPPFAAVTNTQRCFGTDRERPSLLPPTPGQQHNSTRLRGVAFPWISPFFPPEFPAGFPRAGPEGAGAGGAPAALHLPRAHPGPAQGARDRAQGLQPPQGVSPAFLGRAFNPSGMDLFPIQV